MGAPADVAVLELRKQANGSPETFPECYRAGRQTGCNARLEAVQRASKCVFAPAFGGCLVYINGLVGMHDLT